MKRKTGFQRAAALLMALVLSAGFLPTIAFAGQSEPGTSDSDSGWVDSTQTYTITMVDGKVKDGNFVADGRYTAKPGDTVTIYPANKTSEGKVFTGWASDNPSVQFTKIDDLYSSFEMPGSDVTITAQYEDDNTGPIPDKTYALIIEKGTVLNPKIEGFKAGDLVEVEAHKPAPGMMHKGWSWAWGKGPDTYIVDGTKLSFLMPDHDVVMRATYMEEVIYPKVYTVTFESGEGSPVASQRVEEGLKAGRPADPTREGYKFTGWYADQGLTKPWNFENKISENMALYAGWEKGVDPKPEPKPDNNDYGDDTGSSSSTAPSTEAQVPATPEAARNVAAEAVRTAQTAGSNIAAVAMRNPGAVSQEIMSAIAAAAGDTAIRVNADTISGNAVDVRIRLNPALVTGDLNLSASTVSAAAQERVSLFETWFQNTVTAVSLGQKGSFGQPVEIAAKVSADLDVKTLVFYAYDAATNSYAPIPAPNYWLDTSGYIHFTTSVGGDIIITDKPLAAK